MLKWSPIAVLVIYAILASIYSAATPAFEAPDENYHFSFIEYVANTGQLPVQESNSKTPWNQEGGQPPLYYLLAAPIVRLAGASDPEFLLPTNPHAEIGVGVAEINHNFFLHNSAEAFPWRGEFLSLHLVRLAGILLGCVTIFAVYRTGLLIFPDNPGIALLAMALAAFNPMFLFISASVNNDNLVTTLSAVAIWLILLIRRQGFTWRRAGMLGLLIPLAGLSKVSGLGLYVVAIALFAILLIKRRLSFRQAVLSALLFVVAFVLVLGWWLLRNLALYNDPLALRVVASVMQPRPVPYTLSVMLNEMEGLRISSWALFGWFNVIGPGWFFLLMDIFTALTVIGGIWWAMQQIQRRTYELFQPLGLLGLHFLVVFAALISWNRTIQAMQGRLLFPAITALAILAAVGWHTLGTIRGNAQHLVTLRTGLIGIPALLISVMAFLLPFFTIIPAYAAPPTVAQVPPDAVPVNVRFDTVEVLGFRVDHQPVHNGDTLPITLYYRGQPDARNLSLYLTALDQSQQPIGKIDSYPGGGNLPTSIWQPNVIYVDTYKLPIKSNVSDPMQGRIQFGWWDFATKQYLNPVHDDGSPLDSLILHGGTILPTEPGPAPAIKQQAVFSGALRLNGYTLSPAHNFKVGDQLQVSLNWQGMTTVYEDFTVFVHLETPDGKVILQDDSPPLRGDYPTSAWAVGQPFNDTHTLKLDAPGTYRLSVGLYRPKDLTRLPVDTGGDALILQTPIVVQ